MAKNIHIRDNVAVKCNIVDENFWILLCDKMLHMVQEDFTNGPSQKWHPREWVLQGFWYEKLRPNNRLYILCDDFAHAFVFSHLVVSSKFSMPPIAHNV
jgi:hypothetical protein